MTATHAVSKPIAVTPAYRPGLHILATFTAAAKTLQDMERCHAFFDALIAEHGLVNVGEAYHQFAEGGYTAIVALTESHLSIHTWPEHGIATFDVFLSNFLRDNSATVQALYKSTLRFFNGIELSKTELYR